MVSIPEWVGLEWMGWDWIGWGGLVRCERSGFKLGGEVKLERAS